MTRQGISRCVASFPIQSVEMYVSCDFFEVFNSSLQEFRKNLLGLTDVTHSYFDKLVKQLEQGFDTLQDDYKVYVNRLSQSISYCWWYCIVLIISSVNMAGLKRASRAIQFHSGSGFHEPRAKSEAKARQRSCDRISRSYLTCDWDGWWLGALDRGWFIWCWGPPPSAGTDGSEGWGTNISPMIHF